MDSHTASSICSTEASVSKSNTAQMSTRAVDLVSAHSTGVIESIISASWAPHVCAIPLIRRTLTGVMTMVLLPGVMSRFSTRPDFWLMNTAGMLGLPWPDGLDMMMSASYLSSYTMAATAPADSALLTCPVSKPQPVSGLQSCSSDKLGMSAHLHIEAAVR